MKRYAAMALAVIALFSACGQLPTEDDDKKPDEKTTEKPATALDLSYGFSAPLSASKDIAVPANFSGTVYLDKACKLEAGSIVNGTIAFALKEMAAENLMTASKCPEEMVFTPNTGHFSLPWLYAEKTGSSDVYELSGSSGNKSWAKFAYSDIDAKLTGSWFDGTRTNKYACDLYAGWNWADWSWPDENTRVCETKRYDSYTWTLSLVAAAPVPDTPGVGRDFTDASLSGNKLISTPTAFSGTLFVDEACAITAGTIENGVIKISLPALKPSQCNSVSSATTGMSFSPSTGRWTTATMYVKNNDTDDTTKYTLKGSLSDSSSVRFIYSDTETKVSGSFTGKDAREYTYDCNLAVGWNVCVWSWDDINDTRTCSKNNAETDVSSVTKWELTNW